MKEEKKRPAKYRVRVPSFGRGVRCVFVGRNFAYARKKAREYGRFSVVEYDGDAGWEVVYEVC